MMLTQRIIALFIDAFIFSGCYELCRQILPENIFEWGNGVIYLLIFLPFLFRDIIFKNASIGKKIMGIAIYDNNWQSPKILSLLKRSFLTLTVGYMILMKSKFIDGEVISFFDWERDFLKMRVVDKKVYQQLQDKAKNPRCKDNMTQLYDQYVRDNYIKHK